MSELGMIAGRYALQEQLGQGSFGQVFRALDTWLGDEEVALKLSRRPSEDRLLSLWREASILRRLRLPGVARLLDEGKHQRLDFIVMELASGTTLDSLHGLSWEAMRPVLTALLNILWRVHEVGVVHGDLKPSNILVDALGRPTVLDFGLSRNTYLPGVDDLEQLMGTAAYIAPEQLRGEPISKASDVYALGVIFFELFMGHAPHPTENLAQLAFARLMQPPPPLSNLTVEDIPAEICALVTAMLAIEPSDRPKDAREVLSIFQPLLTKQDATLLDGLLGSFDQSPPTRPEDLESLFRGHELLHHQRSSPAAHLWARIKQDPAQLRAELSSWLERGLATWREGGIWVERQALLQLEPSPSMWDTTDARTHIERAQALEPGQQGRAWELLMAPQDEQTLTWLMQEARVLDERGLIHDAHSLLEDTLRLVKSSRALAPLRAPLLEQWAELVLTQGEPEAIERVLHEVAQVPALAPLTMLMEAARQVCRSEASAGLKALNAIGPMANLELELRRQQYRVQASWKLPLARMRELLDDLEPWAKAHLNEEGQATVLGWRGMLAYKQGDPQLAARLHEQAAQGKRRATARLSSLLNSASAYIEAVDHERALEMTIAAQALAASIQHAHYEGRARILERAARYRMEQALAPSLELVEAIGALDLPELEGLVCLYEAAIAWRADELELACVLAQRSRRLWSRSGNRWGAHLAHALSLGLCQGAEQAQLTLCAQQLLGCPLKKVALQGLAMMAPQLSDELLCEARALYDQDEPLQDPLHERVRQEILSLAEVKQRLTSR